jgi:diguanylate cyclase (GGDEF)-like protein/PAS domain S-box-containing protein
MSLNSEFFVAVLEGLRTGVYVVDRDSKIVFWNDGAERITGHLRQEMMGRSCRDNFLGQADGDQTDLTGELSPVSVAMRDGKRVEKQVSLRHKDGYRVPVRLYTFPIRGEHGAVIAVAESFEESISIAEWERRQTKLATYGCLDEVSGVLNHSMMQAHLREVLGTFAEHPVPFSILCLEIDRLDQIQARDGPGAVASVLRIVAQTLENSVRPTDFLGRWQENQFLAILTECSATEVARAAERLRRMVSTSKVEWWGDPLQLTISLGGAAVVAGDTVESLVLRAEEALRESVVQGGNCVVVRTELAPQ